MNEFLALSDQQSRFGVAAQRRWSAVTSIIIIDCNSLAQVQSPMHISNLLLRCLELAWTFCGWKGVDCGKDKTPALSLNRYLSWGTFWNGKLHKKAATNVMRRNYSRSSKISYKSDVLVFAACIRNPMQKILTLNVKLNWILSYD